MEESLGSRVLQQIKELCELAGIKTEEYARVSRKKIDALSLEREVARKKSALGQRVYELNRQADPPDVWADAEVIAILARIEQLEADLGAQAREIGSIRDASQGRTAEVRKRYEVERAGAGNGGSARRHALARSEDSESSPWGGPEEPQDSFPT